MISSTPMCYLIPLVMSLVVSITVGLRPSSAQAATAKAIQVFGQPDFTANDPNHGAATDGNGLNFPLGLTVDGKGGIYVADRNNNRVLYFAPDSDPKADRVYGQFGSFTSNVKNNDGKGGAGMPSAENLNMPTAVTLDSKGGLYVTDRDNHRVLYFAADGDTKADGVYGQFGSFTTDAVNNGGQGNASEPNAESIGVFSLGVAVDRSDGLYVSDSSNNRVLYFAPDGDTKADKVYGQFGSFKTNVPNNDGTGKVGLPNAENLTFPRGLTLDSKGGLYVGDRDNHRVLYFAPDGDTKADKVYGQFGSFNTNAPNNNGRGQTQNGAPSAENLFSPRGLALDVSGGLYVSDSNNNRVLYFAPDGDIQADRVYGQFGNFAMNALNNGGKNTPKLPSAENLAGPQYVAVGVDGKVYVSDTVNHRLLVYEAAK